MSDSDWERDLARLGAAVRPVEPGAGAVLAAVRQRRRRRRTGVVLGTAALVAVVASAGAVVGAVVGAGGHPPGGGAPATSSPTADPTAEETAVPAADFTCPTHDEVDRTAPPIEDLVAQEAIVRAAQAPMKDFAVTAVRPTAVGVIALVEGSLPIARTVLGDLGVAHVYEDVASEVGADADRIALAVQWLLDPTLAWVREETRGVDGDAGPAYWTEAGAIVVSWKAPVPPRVLALAGPRPNGTRVLVQESRYSSADVQRAQRRLETYLEGAPLRERWSSAYACHDGAGLIVGIVPPVDDRAELQVELAGAVGMPVRVVPEERPVDLLPGR